MVNALYLLLLNALFIFGIHTLFSEGHLLEGAGKVIEREIGSYWSKPLFLCVLCMSSIYGTAGFILGVFYYGFPFWMWVPYCIALCGLNTIINDLKSKHFTIDSED